MATDETYKEPKLFLLWLLLRHKVAKDANSVEEEQGTQAHGRIELCPWQGFQGVDDDSVGRSTVVDTRDTHQGRNLTHTNTDGCTGHERGNCNEGNEFDDSTKSGKANEKQNRSSDDGKRSCNVNGLKLGLGLLNLDDNVADNSAHDSYGSDGYILGGCESPVQDETNEAGVEAILSWQLCKQSVCHTLRNDDEADSHTSDNISKKPCQVVVKDPVPEGEQTPQVALDSTSRRLEMREVFFGCRLTLDV